MLTAKRSSVSTDCWTTTADDTHSFGCLEIQKIETQLTLQEKPLNLTTNSSQVKVRRIAAVGPAGDREQYDLLLSIHQIGFHDQALPRPVD